MQEKTVAAADAKILAEVIGELKDADRVLGRLWRGLVSG